MTDTAATKGWVRAPGEGVEGIAWFALMVAGWSAFSMLLIAAPERLQAIWDWLVGLALGWEIAMWILLLPWALGLAVWQSSWQTWVRYLLIALLGAFWTSSSKPRATT